MTMYCDCHVRPRGTRVMNYATLAKLVYAAGPVSLVDEYDACSSFAMVQRVSFGPSGPFGWVHVSAAAALIFKVRS